MFDVARPPSAAYTGPIRILTTWSTPHPGFAETLRLISELPEGEPERHEAEAFLHITLARASWRTADRLRDTTRRSTHRRAVPTWGAGGRADCPVCGVTGVHLNKDGTLRSHDPDTRGRGSFTTQCAGSGYTPTPPST